MSFSEWEEVRLGDVCTYVSAKVSVSEVIEDNYISTENMLPNKSGVIKSSGLPTVGSVTKYSAGNVLVSNIRPYFRKIWYADRNGGCSNDVLVFDINDSKTLDSKFLFYCLSNNVFFDYVMAGSKGTKMPRGDKGAIMKYPVLLPPLSEQKAIAATLSALDDMIELNNQINKNLEEMAQAIFKSWFVDFEPFKDGEFEESELGLIPKGWKVGTVGDLCTDIFSGGTPLTSNPKFWNGKHPWLASGETRTSIIVKTEKSITDEGVVNSSTRLAKKYDIVIASAGQGHTRGQTAITLIDTYINQSVIALRAEVYGYLFCNLRNRYNELRAISDSSSIRGSLTTKIMKQFPILLPPEEVLTAFQGIFEEIIEYCGQSALQNVTLSEIRDTLLPKLMSEEVRVPVEEVV